MASDELIAELDSHAPRVGANVGLWPGLTVYRFTAPMQPRRDEVHGLALGIVAQGRTAVTVGRRRNSQDQLTYVVVGSRLQFLGEVLDASDEQPCLCLLLQLEPTMVRSTSTQMLERSSPSPGGAHPDACVVATLDDELTSAVVRFLRALPAETDRRVLAPLYLQELIYRILQRDRSSRVPQFAAEKAVRSPVAEAISYIHRHLAEPVAVPTLARHVNLSPSAFSRLFRDATGGSPYQYVKHARLNRARELLADERLSVSDIAGRIGYSSTSHFIKEFRARFGATPGRYRVTP